MIPRVRRGGVPDTGRVAASVTPVGGGHSTHEISEGDADGVGDTDQGVQLGAGVALLNAVVGGEVDAGPPAHVWLGEVVVLADAADLVSHLAAAGDDPVVGRGGAWHQSTFPTS